MLRKSTTLQKLSRKLVPSELDHYDLESSLQDIFQAILELPELGREGLFGSHKIRCQET